MADTLVKNPKLIVGTQSQVEAEMGANDIGFATDIEFYTAKQIDELLSKAGGASLPILMPVWSDHLLNDMSWLCADTFSWQPGDDTYKAAYEHLLSDYNSSTLQTDIIGDIIITYYLAEDGHKICLPDQESNLITLYEQTGVAWYYILDTENKQFKLPRISPDKENIATSAPVTLSASGALKLRQNGAGTTDIKNYANDGLNTFGAYNVSGSFSNTGATGSGSAYMKYESGITGTTDLTNATSYFAGKKHLYFYVGNFEKTAVEQTAGLNAEMFNDLNAHKVIEFQTPTSANGYTWYRKYADGWVEQGGLQTSATGSAGVTVTLPVAMADANYTIAATVTDVDAYFVGCLNKTTTSFLWRSFNADKQGYDKAGSWQVSGIAA